jgi:hypothetical protein
MSGPGRRVNAAPALTTTTLPKKGPVVTPDILPERWLPVAGYPSYSVSDRGRVRREAGYQCRTPRILRPRCYFGYAVVSLCKNGQGGNRRVHRLVLEAFVGPCPEGMQCRHLDGDPTNNRPANLCWGTPAENGADAVRLGETACGDRHGSRTHPERVPRGERHSSRTHPERVPRGERHGHAKLTERAVRALLQLLAEGEKQSSLAHIFNVSNAVVSLIRRGKIWRHVPRNT